MYSDNVEGSCSFGLDRPSAVVVHRSDHMLVVPPRPKDNCRPRPEQLQGYKLAQPVVVVLAAQFYSASVVASVAVVAAGLSLLYCKVEGICVAHAACSTAPVLRPVECSAVSLTCRILLLLVVVVAVHSEPVAAVVVAAAVEEAPPQ